LTENYPLFLLGVQKSPWFFGLTVKIFRRHPQLAPNVHAVLSDVANAPQSRAEMLREKQQRRIDSKKIKVGTSRYKGDSKSASAATTTPAGHSKGGVGKGAYSKGHGAKF
jgi:hypothetical protein